LSISDWPHAIVNKLAHILGFHSESIKCGELR
jgi:hypothetical protein